MQIILNGNIYHTQDRITVHELVAQLKYHETNFAIAINLEVLPRSSYHERWLKEHDKVEIVTAFQGG